MGQNRPPDAAGSGTVRMTPETFDRLTRRLATTSPSRRGLFGALAGGVAAAVVGAFHRPSPAAAQMPACGDLSAALKLRTGGVGRLGKHVGYFL